MSPVHLSQSSTDASPRLQWGFRLMIAALWFMWYYAVTKKEKRELIPR